MNSRDGLPSTRIFGDGNAMVRGNVSIMSCDATFVSQQAGKPNPALLSLIANRSKAVPFVVMPEATTGGKKIWGRKRHVLVDAQGLVISVKVLAADSTDREGGKELLTPLVGMLPRLQVIWADSGYAGNPFRQWVKEHLGVRLEIVKHAWTGVRGVWVPEGVQVDWDKIIPKGFHVLPKRWVVERTFGWITRYRRLSRDFEGTYSSGEAFIYLAMTRRMVSRLAHTST
jgi:putative transposase